jgi:hypothetical protein
MRNMLHVNKLEEFKRWLDSREIPHREGVGTYQVLQVKCGEHWPAIYFRTRNKSGTAPLEHLTVAGRPLQNLVMEFFEERRSSRSRSSTALKEQVIAADKEE